MALIVGEGRERLIAGRISYRNYRTRHNRTLRVGDFSFDPAAGAVRHYKRERGDREREHDDNGFESSWFH